MTGTITVNHASTTGAAADPTALVDGPKWDAAHSVTFSLTSADVGLGNVPNTDATNASNLSSGTVPAARMPALTGDVTTSSGAVATTIGANKVTNAKLATMAAYTIKINATSGAAVPADVEISTLTTKASPTGSDWVILSDQAAGGAIKKAAFPVGGGVTSVNGQTGALTIPIVPFGRLTLTTGTAITEADVTAAATIYFTPSAMDYAGVYDGSNFAAQQFAELSLALDSNAGHSGYHQSGKNFFCGVFMNTGVITLGTSVAWSSDTATGTGAGTCETEIFQGRLVNKVSMTVRFGSASGNTVSVAARQFLIVGGFRASADGQTTDSKTKRFVSNLYNAVPRKMLVTDATQTTYTYSTATFRQARADTANQLALFHCVAGRTAKASLRVFVTTSTATARFVTLGIGLDSTTTAATDSFYGLQAVTSALGISPRAEYLGTPGIGYHTLVWLEGGAGTDTQTWDPTLQYSGLLGEVLN